MAPSPWSRAGSRAPDRPRRPLATGAAHPPSCRRDPDAGFRFDRLTLARQKIDELFGDGHATLHPELVVRGHAERRQRLGGGAPGHRHEHIAAKGPVPPKEEKVMPDVRSTCPRASCCAHDQHPHRAPL